MFKNHDIGKPARHDEAADDFSQGKQVTQDFWESPTIDELAESQNVQPMVDGQTLFGTWPGEVDDGFETIIEDMYNRAQDVDTFI